MKFTATPHTGPWKLNGLPGVMMDADDAKNEVVFTFDGRGAYPQKMMFVTFLPESNY